jgi:hypothetical protein
MRTHFIPRLALLVLGVVLAVVSILWIAGTWEWILFAVGAAVAVLALIALVVDLTSGHGPVSSSTDPTIGGRL